MMADDAGTRSVLVTGAAGYLGRQLVLELARARRTIETLVAVDVRETPARERASGVVYAHADVRDRALPDLFRRHAVDTVVHLAAIVTPGPRDTVELEYSVDVLGTQNVLQSCLATGVRRLIYTSSGAAYGYWPDNPRPLVETDALRGNDAFAYSRHKRLVEEMLARHRSEHPELRQLVLRPGTILGETTSNQITAMFERPVVIGVRGSDVPFVFIWDRDVVDCLALGVHENATGVYNLAGDGFVTLLEIARRLGKPYLALPAWLLRTLLAVLHPLGLSRYGPEQVDFLRYRPVLSNEALRSKLGYRPTKTSSEAFDAYAERISR